MSFVSAPPPPAPDAPTTVQNDGWWPDVDLTLVCKEVRIHENVTAERLRAAVVHAIDTVNRQLAAWRAVQEEAAHADLSAVPAPELCGENRLLSVYRRAVATMAAAALADTLRDLGTTAAGHDRADELEEAASLHRRDAAWAIRDLQGLPRSTVELI